MSKTAKFVYRLVRLYQRPIYRTQAAYYVDIRPQSTYQFSDDVFAELLEAGLIRQVEIPDCASHLNDRRLHDWSWYMPTVVAA